jgi:predicted Zn-dependent protease
MISKKLLFILILVPVIAIILYCAVNPVTGKKELMLYSEQDEIQLGIQTDKQIQATYGLYDDPELSEYISELGHALAEKTHRPQLDYHFKVLDTPVVNAFAVPGGYIYFTRGILAYFNNEAELAGVLAHELGHVAARHSMSQYSKATLAQLGLGLGTILSEDFREIAGLGQFGVSLLFLKFSRDDERQADALGVEYSVKAGYDARKLATFFNTLQRLQPGDNGNALPEWASTHPDPKDRSQAILKYYKQWQQQISGPTDKINREPYLGHIDNLAFGQDPKQGYVKENTFYHPELQFVFPVPANWQVNNLPSQVQMIPKQQDATILMMLAEGNSLDEAADKFIADTKADVKQIDAIRVHGLKGRRVLSIVGTGEDALNVMSHFIAKDNRIYTLHGVAKPTSYAAYVDEFQRVLNNFKDLNDQSKINVQVNRLILKRVSSSGTLKASFQSWGIPQEEWENTAILNGMDLSEQTKKGQKIKVINRNFP